MNAEECWDAQDKASPGWLRQRGGQKKPPSRRGGLTLPKPVPGSMSSKLVGWARILVTKRD